MGRAISILLLGVVVSASGAVGCGVPRDTRAASVPGVVLVCIDTLRADALGTPGEGPVRLPALARFAAEGVTFLDASSTAPWTCPSVASLLTGLLPRRHGAPLASHDSRLGRMSPQVGTLAQALRDAGWSTAAYTGGAWVSPEMGLALGFDRFSTNFDLHPPSFSVEAWGKERPKDRPFFLFLHTYAAHDPYGDKDRTFATSCTPGQDVERLGARLSAALDAGGRVDDALYTEFVAARWTDPCTRPALDRVLGPIRLQALLERLPEFAQGGWRRVPGTDLPARLRAAYEAGLAFADYRLDRALKALRALPLPEGTVVVVVGDHGEAFGEDGHVLHGQSLHDAVLRVPLVVRAPGRFRAGTLARGGCSVVDVMPTILDLAGIATPAGLDGASLVPLAAGRGAGRPAFAEGEAAAGADEPSVALASVRTPAGKWVLAWHQRTGATLREEVYDLVEDPGERSPLPPVDLGRFGDAFCRAVDRVRSDVASRFSVLPAPPDCP